MNNIVIEEFIPYLPTAVGFEFDSILNYQLPGVSEKCNNLWFFVQDKKETRELIKELKIAK